MSLYYDVIYRLTEAVASSPGYSPDKGQGKKGKGVSKAVQNQKEYYQYDAVGNRTTSSEHTSYTHNAGNELLSADSISYTYDANGNRTQKIAPDGTTVYTWDYDNRLLNVVLPDGSGAEYAYDPFVRRIEKTVVDEEGSKTITYLYDGEDIVAEVDGSGDAGNIYVHGPGIDEPLALLGKMGPVYYHADGLGSIVAMTDSRARNIQWYDYDSYGNQHDMKNRIKQPYGYTGREHDRETGLRYYRARYYDGEVGRFISEDPVAIGGNYYNGKYNVTYFQYVESLSNPFLYTQNNSVNWRDPYGLYKCAKGVNCDFTPTLDNTLKCLEKCMGTEYTVTSGVRGTGGTSHSRGEAADLGENTNKGICREDMEKCYKKCFPNGAFAQHEDNSSSMPGYHYHFQTNEGKGYKWKPYFKPGTAGHTNHDE